MNEWWCSCFKEFRCQCGCIRPRVVRLSVEFLWCVACFAMRVNADQRGNVDWWQIIGDKFIASMCLNFLLF